MRVAQTPFLYIENCALATLWYLFVDSLDWNMELSWEFAMLDMAKRKDATKVNGLA